MGWPLGGGGGQSTDSILVEGLGLQAMPYFIGAKNANTACVSGRLYGGAIGLRAGMTITNIVMPVQTGATALTLARAAIYSSALSLLASSASVHATLNGAASGWYDIPLSSAYQVPETGLYYLAFMNVGTTGATIYMCNQGATEFSGGGAYARMTFQQSSLSDLPSTVTPTNSSSYPWLACS